MGKKDTYTMVLTEEQVKWLLNKDKTKWLQQHETELRMDIEKQNHLMQEVVSVLVDKLRYKEPNPKEKNNSFLLSYFGDGEWKDEWINKERLVAALMDKRY